MRTLHEPVIGSTMADHQTAARVAETRRNRYVPTTSKCSKQKQKKNQTNKKKQRNGFDPTGLFLLEQDYSQKEFYAAVVLRKPTIGELNGEFTGFQWIVDLTKIDSESR